MKTTTIHRLAGARRYQAIVPSLCLCGLLLLCTLSLTSRTAFASELDQPIQLDIPAHTPLDQALIQWGKRTGMQVMIATHTVAQLTTEGVKGTLSARAALESLLKGSGLTYSAEGNAVTVAPDNSLQHRPSALQTAPPSVDYKGGSNRTGKLKGRREDSERSPTGQNLQEIIVTGTHLRGISPTSPIVILDSTDIERSGYTDIGGVLRTLPQNFSGGSSPQLGASFGPDPTNNASYSGGSAPNLHGLGPGSTLTLVDGHRVALDGPYAVDVSLIPLSAVERVEIVADGASAVYGSDAVAGVVNIILKKSYDGAQSTGSVGRATDGGAFDRKIDQLLGRSWDSGSVIFDFEHDKQDPVYSSQRDFTSSVVSPYTLLPAASRNSLFTYSHQQLSTGIEGFVDGLYTARGNEFIASYPPSFSLPSSIRQFQVSIGVSAELPSAWKTTASASAADQRTNYGLDSFLPGVAGHTALDQQLLRGTARTLEIMADGPLSHAAGGPIRAAIGVGYRRDSYDDSDVTLRQVYSNGRRSVKYAFTELGIPLVGQSNRSGLMRLEFNASARYESYSDVGSKAVPRVGVLYQPWSDLSVRASWGKSFRAPSLYDEYQVRTVLLGTVADPHSPSGTANALFPTGGNPNLGPETATSWTSGLDYRPAQLKGLSATLTYFDIAYKDRIASIGESETALTDPASAPFVTRSPSAAEQSALIADANGGFFNETASPYDPKTIAAIVDQRPINLARQHIYGADLLLDCKCLGVRDNLDVFLNAAYLELRQRVTAFSAEQELAGRSFSPPRLRARGGVSWYTGPWSMTSIVNYLAPAVNTYLPNDPSVSSWTTVDVQVAYSPTLWTGLQGTRLSVSVENLLDRDPPAVEFDLYSTGFHYDNLNASPLNRFVNIQVVKAW